MKRPIFYLFCDESGAKGYSDKPEQEGEPLGVVVGMIINELQLPLLKDACAEIYKRYSTDSSSKFHLADILSERQKNLRNDVFNIIKKIKARLVYSSIQKGGMFEWCNTQKNMYDEIVSKEKERGYSISFPNPKESMLEMLYYDNISRFFAAIVDCHVNDGNFTAKIFIDQIDLPILNAIENKVKMLTTDPSHSKKEVKSSRYHYESNTLEKAKATIELNIKIPDSLSANELANIDFEIQIDDSLVIFPDVIANSLLYLAKNNLQKNPDVVMNSSELILGHPLADYFVSTSEPDDYDFLRALYSRRNNSTPV